MTLRRIAGMLLLVAAAVIGAAAQQVRDGAVPQPTGTAAIAGVVVAADTGNPIRNARVALTGVGQSQPIGRLTDDHGAFTFDNLPPGIYRLWAARSGFVTTSYGTKRPGSEVPGRPILLSDKQRIEKLQLHLPRAGVLSGVVLDVDGEPALGATVMAQRIVYRAGKRGLTPGGTAFADDLGGYRMTVQPGEYLVSATLGPHVTFSESMQSMSSRMAGARQGNAPAMLMETGTWVRESPVSGAMAFYPRGNTTMSAMPVVVGPAEDRPGIDIHLHRWPAFAITGFVESAAGPVSGATLYLLPAGEPFEDFSGGLRVGGGARSAADGGFKMGGVVAGSYTLVALHDGRTSGGQVEWYQQDLHISGPVAGLNVVLQSGLTVTGTIATDDGSPVELPQAVALTPLDSHLANARSLVHPFGSILNGRFAATGVWPGRYRIGLAQSSEWQIASAAYGARDAMDVYLDVAPGDKPSLRVVLTRRRTELSGAILGFKPGEDNFNVIAFSPEERHWVPEGRRLSAVEPDLKGRFVFTGLPPGQYRLALMEDYDAAAGLYPELLRQLAAASSVFVTLTDGEKKVQDFRVR